MKYTCFTIDLVFNINMLTFWKYINYFISYTFIGTPSKPW